VSAPVAPKRKLRPRTPKAVHADASVIYEGLPRALCFEFERGSLQYHGAHTCEMSANPKAVTCKNCLGVLSDRGQLYAIMLEKSESGSHTRAPWLKTQ